MPGAAGIEGDAGASVRQAIERHHLLAAGEKVVVGFSGGPDSLALLHILTHPLADLGLSVRAAHLNHSLRGADSDADADFCAETCAAWGVPVVVERCDVGALARERGLAVEEAARQVRYAFFARVAAAEGAAAVAVAHNADDQVETVLMHLLRGSGLAGLRGMLPSVPLSGLRLGGLDGVVEGVRLIRPLLRVPRTGIELYLRLSGLTARFDRSNLDTTYYRNRLRHELIPYLESYNPNVREVLRRTADLLAADHDFMHAATERAWQEVLLSAEPASVVLGLAGYAAQHLSMRRSLIRRAIGCLRPSLRDVSFVHVERAVEDLEAARGAGAMVTLPAGLVLTVGYDRFTISDAGQAVPAPRGLPQLPAGFGERRLTLPADVPLAQGWRLSVRVVAAEALPADATAARHPWRAYLDADYVAGGLILRGRREGDRMQPLGMGGHGKRLNELMINLKVPAASRPLYPLLANAEHVLWLPGHHIDHRARIVEKTRRVLIAEVEEG